MLNSKSFLAVFTLFVIVFLPGCEKNGVVQVQEIQSPKQLTKIFQDANNLTSLDYINNKLSSYTTVSNSDTTISISLNYDNKELPQSENYSGSGMKYLRKFNYDATGKMIKADYLFQDSSGNYSINFYKIYNYNALDQLVRTEQYNYTSATQGFVHSFDIDYKYDSNGNVIEKGVSDSLNLLQKQIMTYDNKINPMYQFRNYFNYDNTLSRNNLLSTTFTDYSFSPNNSITSYLYKYDANGYPLTSEVEVTADNNVYTFHFIYEYQ